MCIETHTHLSQVCSCLCVSSPEEIQGRQRCFQTLSGEEMSGESLGGLKDGTAIDGLMFYFIQSDLPSLRSSDLILTWTKTPRL